MLNPVSKACILQSYPNQNTIPHTSITQKRGCERRAILWEASTRNWDKKNGVGEWGIILSSRVSTLFYALQLQKLPVHKNLESFRYFLHKGTEYKMSFWLQGLSALATNLWSLLKVTRNGVLVQLSHSHLVKNCKNSKHYHFSVTLGTKTMLF